MRRAIVLSAILHIVIITLLFCHFYQHKKYKVGNNNVIHAYIYPKSFLIKNVNLVARNANSQHNKRKNIAKTRIHKRGEEIVIKRKNEKSFKQIVKSKLAEQQLSGRRNELLIILHNLIQQNIVYPSSLTQFVKNRNIIVAFDLYSDGHLDNIAIVHSSKVVLLDRLAKQAVEKIQPVTVAAKLLKSKSHFQVAVVFK